MKVSLSKSGVDQCVNFFQRVLFQTWFYSLYLPMHYLRKFNK